MVKKEKKSEKVKMLEGLLKTLDLSEKVVTDNKIPFEHGKNRFRVRVPNTGEVSEAEKERNAYYIKLLQDKSYLTNNQLVELYKKKDIDIGKLDEKFKATQDELDNLMVKLAKIPSNDKEALEFCEEKIGELQSKQVLNSREKANYLQYSIENAVEHFWYSYLTYLVTERLEEEKWIKHWATYEDFKKSEVMLSSKATIQATKLLMGLRPSEMI